MLSFLFNKQSPIVTLMELVGVIFALLIFRTDIIAPLLTFWLYVITVGLYGFIRLCTMIRWYSRKGNSRLFFRNDYPGIELQLKKAMVPISYILALSMAWLYFGLPSKFLFVTIFLQLVIAHVNVILIYFHFRDTSPEPVNFLTQH